METNRPPLKQTLRWELDQIRQDATFITLYSLRKSGVPPETIQKGLSMTGNLEWTRPR